MTNLVKIGKGTTEREGSCNFCKRGELSNSGRSLNYPYTYVTTLSTANGGGAKVSICDDCLEHIVLHIGEIL
jgi:hypothetical protein